MNTNKLHILFLSSWYPSEVHQTLGNFVQRHAESVASKHHVTTLYVTRREDQASPVEISDNTIRGVRTVVVYFNTKGLKTLGFRKAFKKGVEYLSKTGFDYDVVHHNVTLNHGWQALVLKRKFGLPYILTEHWTGYHDKPASRIQGLRKLMAKRVVREAGYVCPVSEHLAKAMQDFGLEGNYQVVANVVDEKLFRFKDQVENDRTKLLHVSHLGDRHKNISGMLRAFSKVMNEIPHLDLHIVGDGDIQPHLDYRDKLNIPPYRVLIEGEKALSEIADLMSESQAFLLFSNYENLPCVIAESHVSGLPVISTDVGGISEMINDSNGYLIQKGNEEELEKALLKFSRECDTFDRRQIRENGIKRYSYKHVAEQYDKLYQKLILQ